MYIRHIAVLALTPLCACNYQVYRDGRFDHANPGVYSNWLAKDYQAIVLEPADPLPDSVRYIGDIMVATPAIGIPANSVDSLMTDQLKAEARAQGANLIHIIEKGFLDPSRVRYDARLYAMDDANAARYGPRVDSLHRRLATGVRVHILNHHFGYTLQLFFNDSLVGESGDPLADISYFEFPTAGRISCTDSKKARRGLRLEAGQEYFFKTWCPRGSGCKLVRVY